LPKNNISEISEDLKYMCDRGYRILFLAGGQTRCERIFTELTDHKVHAALVDSVEGTELQKGVVYVTRGSLTNGFEYINDKLAIISDSELFSNEEKKRKRANKKKDRAAAILSFNDLKVGDYVVHENYGIGVYNGIEQIYTDGVCKDYLKLGYANDNVLYVDTNQLGTLQKYVGGDSVKPKITQLGSSSWSKSKARAKKAAMDIAKDLVELYAARQAAKGYEYGKDTVWQKEFEESFPFEETDDQLAAIEDVKNDMESGKVMDRLICGDVGFGKTEVAIRAAFKTVQEGKQVAYLVPTTILASQHYSTFKSRMADYAIRVELLSRFQTPKQSKLIINDLKEGKVDVVIGTHRLLSKDIGFNDLGLIIVDEEQRFGVTHKEKLKALKKNSNVLTLTATPIPRTLHMSMSGIRDMSLLEEAPGQRLPIQTYVMEYNPEFVRDAILRELARDGQVYYLHNRVNNIDDTAATLRKLVPDAEIAIAHGQMTKTQLEDVMTDFINHDIDVLVCTTIVETGLDIPNVNTIIIQDADKMGLSQLYQLRGRVGRSNRSSFAYLMYQKDKVISEVSEKRLQTIREFTEFGSGFRVAMKDLEIRGAGDLLGSQQSGNMDSVGYEMYCKLLDEAVRELKGEVIEADFETLMDLKVNAFIPTKYISGEEQRLEMYKKIALIKNIEDYYAVQEELEDRFGDLPKSVINLLDVAYTKALAHKLGCDKVSQRGKKVLIYFKEDARPDVEKIMAEIVAMKGKLLLTNNAKPYLTYEVENEINPTAEVRELLERLI
jgi:transcription-repair coupling factor (superfamily II helicase)